MSVSTRSEENPTLALASTPGNRSAKEMNPTLEANAQSLFIFWTLTPGGMNVGNIEIFAVVSVGSLLSNRPGPRLRVRVSWLGVVDFLPAATSSGLGASQPLGVRWSRRNSTRTVCGLRETARRRGAERHRLRGYRLGHHATRQMLAAAIPSPPFSAVRFVNGCAHD